MQTGQGPWRSLAKPGPAEPRSSAAAAVAAATLAQEPGAFKGTPQTRQGGCVCPQWGSWTAGHLRRRPRAQDRQWPCPGGCDASHSIPPGNGLEPQACALFHQVLSSQETQLSTRGCPAGPAHAEAQQSPGFRLPAACLPSLPRAHLTAAARAPGGRATRRRLLGTPGTSRGPANRREGRGRLCVCHRRARGCVGTTELVHTGCGPAPGCPAVTSAPSVGQSCCSFLTPSQGPSRLSRPRTALVRCTPTEGPLGPLATAKCRLLHEALPDAASHSLA